MAASDQARKCFDNATTMSSIDGVSSGLWAIAGAICVLADVLQFKHIGR